MILNSDLREVTSFVLDDVLYTLMSSTEKNLTYRAMPYNCESLDNFIEYFTKEGNFCAMLEMITGLVVNSYNYYIDTTSNPPFQFIILSLEVITMEEKINILELKSGINNVITTDLFEYSIGDLHFPCQLTIIENSKNNIRFNNIYYVEFHFSGISDETVDSISGGDIFNFIPKEILPRINTRLNTIFSDNIKFNFDFVPMACKNGICMRGCVSLGGIGDRDILHFSENWIVMTAGEYVLSVSELMREFVQIDNVFVHTSAHVFSENFDPQQPHFGVQRYSFTTNLLCIDGNRLLFNTIRSTNVIDCILYFEDADKDFSIFKLKHRIRNVRFIATINKYGNIHIRNYIESNRTLRRHKKEIIYYNLMKN